MIRTLSVFLGIVILCQFAMALSRRNQQCISYPSDCRVRYIKIKKEGSDYLFETDDPWSSKISLGQIHRNPNLNAEYEEITKLSYDHNHILK